MKALVVGLLLAVSGVAMASGPDAPSAPVNTEQSLVVEVPPHGDVVIGCKVIADRDLDRVFKAAARRDKSTLVVFRVNKAAHERVVSLMIRAKQAGLSRLSVGTAPSSREFC
jgi:biopolymer transport protein ExbD